MLRYYLKIAVRNIRINKQFSIINIAGFAFAISVCLGITLFLIREYSFDRYNVHYRQIVRVTDSKYNSSVVDYRVKDVLLNNFPEIENGCLVLRNGHPIEIKTAEKGFYLEDIMAVDNNFFKIFTIPFSSGKSTIPFPDINSGIITESTSKLLFGEEDPLGKEIFVWGNVPVIITAIISDFPDNSSITAGLPEVVSCR